MTCRGDADTASYESVLNGETVQATGRVATIVANPATPLQSGEVFDLKVTAYNSDGEAEANPYDETLEVPALSETAIGAGATASIEDVTEETVVTPAGPQALKDDPAWTVGLAPDVRVDSSFGIKGGSHLAQEGEHLSILKGGSYAPLRTSGVELVDGNKASHISSQVVEINDSLWEINADATGDYPGGMYVHRGPDLVDQGVIWSPAAGDFGVADVLADTADMTSWKRLWHAGNDGAGSGLDADLWDSRQFSDFLDQGVRSFDDVTHKSLSLAETLGVGGVSTFGGLIESESYTSGWAGTGYRFQPDGFGELSDLSIREVLLARTLEIRKQSFSRGPFGITVGAGTVSKVNYVTTATFDLTFEEPHGCTDQDFLLAQEYDGVTGQPVRQVRGSVEQVIDARTLRLHLIGSYSNPKRGDDFIVYASQDPDRDSMLYLNPYGPYLDVLDFIYNDSAWNARSPLLRLGNLNGSYDYVADRFGLAAGDPDKAWLGVDPTNGLRFMHGADELGFVRQGAIEIGEFSHDGTTTRMSGWTATADRFERSFAGADVRLGVVNSLDTGLEINSGSARVNMVARNNDTAYGGFYESQSNELWFGDDPRGILDGPGVRLRTGGVDTLIHDRRGTRLSDQVIIGGRSLSIYSFQEPPTRLWHFDTNLADSIASAVPTGIESATRTEWERGYIDGSGLQVHLTERGKYGGAVWLSDSPTNLLDDGSFESGGKYTGNRNYFSGVGRNGASGSSTLVKDARGAYSGSHVARLEKSNCGGNAEAWNAIGWWVNLKPSTTYTVTAKVRLEYGEQKRIACKLIPTNGYDYLGGGSDYIEGTGEWERVEIQFTTDADLITAEQRFRFMWPYDNVDGVLYVDEVMLTETVYAVPFHEGSVPNSDLHLPAPLGGDWTVGFWAEDYKPTNETREFLRLSTATGERIWVLNGWGTDWRVQGDGGIDSGSWEHVVSLPEGFDEVWVPVWVFLTRSGDTITLTVYNSAGERGSLSFTDAEAGAWQFVKMRFGPRTWSRRMDQLFTLPYAASTQELDRVVYSNAPIQESPQQTILGPSNIFTPNLEALAVKTGELDVTGQLTMGAVGRITNVNSAFETSEKGYSVFSKGSDLTQERTYQLRRGDDTLVGKLGSVESGAAHLQTFEGYDFNLLVAGQSLWQIGGALRLDATGGYFLSGLRDTEPSSATELWKDADGVLHLGPLPSSPAPSNEPPVASFTYSDLGGGKIAFDSGGSYDPDGSIQSYFWEFPDGTTSTLANPTKQMASGSHVVTLTVTDNDNDSDSVSNTVIV